MQKLLTITINIEKLQEASKGAFTVTEVEDVNVLLEEGWQIEEWEFVTGEDEEGKAVVLLILNDELSEPEFDASAYSSEGDFDDDDASLFGPDDEDAGAEDDSEADGDDAEDDAANETAR